MIENDIISAISNVGFPIVITLYLMVRMETTLKFNSDAIDRNTLALNSLCSKVSKD
jgi:hypothetical protein